MSILSRGVEKRLLFALCVLGCCAEAVAEDDDGLLADETQMLDEYVVTATKTKKLLKDAPVITRVVTSSDIEGINAATIRDVLEAELPGIEFETAMNGTPVINIQGMGGKDVLFLIDGERMAGETLDNVDYNRLNMDNVERIEIVKGAASSLYGSNAIGGVINIITKDAKKPVSVNVNCNVGQFKDIRSGATIGVSKGKWNSMTNLSFKTKDTYDLQGTDAEKSEQTVYGGKDYQIKEKLSFAPTQKFKITAKGEFYFRDRDYHLYKGYDHYLWDANGGLKGEWKLTKRDNLMASYNADRYWKDVVWVYYDLPSERKYENNQHTAKIMYDHKFLKAGQLVAGAEYFYEYLLSDQFEKDWESDIRNVIEESGRNPDDYTYKIESGTPYDVHRMNTTSVYAEHDVNVGKRVNIVYGARLDCHSKFGLNVSPKANFKFDFSPVTLRAGYAAGFRTPSLKELYTDYDMGGLGWFRIIGNPDLKPEKSNNFSLSAEMTKKRINASVSGYVSMKRDAIESEYNEKQDTMVYINAGEVNVAGLDASVTATLPWGFRIRASYAFVHDSYNNVSFSTTRPHSGVIRVDYKLDKPKKYGLNVALTGKLYAGYVIKSKDYNSGEVTETENPGYTVWRLVTTHRIGKAVNVTLGIDNLFNYKPKSYNVVSSYSTGINVFGGVSIDIDKWFEKKKADEKVS